MKNFCNKKCFRLKIHRALHNWRVECPQIVSEKIANILPDGCEHKGFCVETYRKKENENG